MTPATARVLVRRVGPDPDPPADADLLARFARTADPAAFAALVRRHGPMVLAACRRMLPAPDADDAFQAVFVVLLRKAGSVRPAGAVGGWLHGVAVRTAHKARVAAARRRRREMTYTPASPGRQPGDSPHPAEHAELRAVLDEELAKLPEPLRAAVVLCDLAGKTRAEAAADLGCPEGTVAARVFRARRVLADRLTRRGFTAPAVVAAAAVPADLGAAVAGFAAGAAIPAAVRALADGVVRGLAVQPLAVAALAAVAVAAGVLWAATAPVGVGGGAAPPAPAAVPPALVSALAFAPDGKTYLVVAGGKVSVKDAATDRLRWTTPAEAARFTAHLDAVMTMDNDVTRRSAVTGEAQTAIPRPKADTAWHAVAFDAVGARFAAHDGLRVRLFSTTLGTEPVRLTPEFGIPGSSVQRPAGNDVRFSPDGTFAAAVGVLLAANEFGAAVWDAATGRRVLAFPPPNTTGERRPATAAAFGPDGKTFAVAVGKRVHLFDVPAFTQADVLPDAPGVVTALAFAPDGKRLAVGYRRPLVPGGGGQLKVGGDKTEVQLVDLAAKTERQRFDGFEGGAARTVLPVMALAFSPDGKTLLAGTGLPPMTPIPLEQLRAGEVKRFAVADPPAKVEVPAWREKAKLPPFEDRVHSVAFSPDGKALAVGGRGGAAQHTVTMWDAAGLRKTWAGGPLPAGTTGVSFSPDGKLLAATRDQVTGLYDAATGRPEPIDPPLPGGKAVAFGLPGPGVAGQMRYKLAVTDGQDVTVVTWGGAAERTNTGFGPGNERARKVDDPRPAAVAYSPSGERLVFIPNAVIDYGFGEHWAAYTWTGTGGPGSVPALPHGKHGTTAPVSAVAWSPDGKHVATGCRKGDVVVWDATTFKELRRTRLGGRGGESEIRALAFAPDGRTLAAAVSLDEGKNAERVALLDPATGERRGSDLQGFGNFTAVSLAFAPDGRTLAVGLADFLPQVQLPPGGVDRPLGSVVLFTTDPAVPLP